LRLLVIPKSQLSGVQLQDATQRVFAPEHASDVGPRYYWNRREFDHRHFILFDAESDEFIGTVYCVILPPVVQDFTWWIDTRKRKQGYWRALADDFAAYLKRRHGVTTVGFITFGGQNAAASHKIAQRLRDHFTKAAPAGSRA